MTQRTAFVGALMAGTFLAGNAWAATIEVRNGGSIQAAINKAGPGDTILVQPGTYSPFEINRDNITIRSAVPGGAHVVATGSRQPAIASYGQNNIAVLDFRLTSKNGDGVKIGGSASRDVQNIQFKGNTVETAALDGLKFFQAKNLQLVGNTIKVAGTARNGNGDGGVDFVGVDNSTVRNNEITRTFGHACFMMKGGSNGNTVTGNNFSGCERDGITVGGFTDRNLMDASDKGLEAHGNKITGNRIQAGSGKCPVYSHKAAGNTLAGNQLLGGRAGCSSAGGGAVVDLVNAGAGTGSTWEGGIGEDSIAGGAGSEAVYQPVSATTNNAACSLSSIVHGMGGGGASVGSIVNGAGEALMGAITGSFGSIVSGLGGMFGGGGGRASEKMQKAQQVQLFFQSVCDAQMASGIGTNVVGTAGGISSGVGDTLRLSNEADVNKAYQGGASADLSPAESLAYQQDLRARTDAARRNALETAEKDAAAQKEYAKMADEALELSQSAHGQTSAIQAQAQLDRAREGAAASRASTQLAFEHARLMTEEEQRAGERLGMQRRDRLYRRLAPENAPPVQPFQMFQ